MTRKTKNNWRTAFQNRLFIDLYDYLDEDHYLRIEYVTHEKVRFLFGGQELWFGRPKGHCKQTYPEYRTNLPFPAWAFLFVLADTLMKARWRSFQSNEYELDRLLQMSAADWSLPILYSIGRAHASFLLAGDMHTYHVHRGWITDTSVSTLSPRNLLFLEHLSRCCVSGIETACKQQAEHRIKKPKLSRKQVASMRFIQKDLFS